MPKIPQYEATEKLQPSNMGAEAYAQLGYHGERMAAETARLVEQGANEFRQGMSGLDEQQAQAQTASGLSQLAQLHTQALGQFQTTMNTADPNGENPVPGFLDDLQAKQQAILDKTTNPRARDALQRSSDDTRLQFAEHGQEQWGAQMKSSALQSLSSMGTSYQNQATLDPARVDDIAGSYSKDMDTFASTHPGALSADDLSKAKKNGVTGIYNMSALQLTAQIDKNPNAQPSDIEKAKSILAGDNFKNNTSPEVYQKVHDDLDHAIGTRQDAYSLYVDKMAPKLIAKAQQFGDPDGSIGKQLAATAVHTPEELAAAAVRIDGYNTALQEHKVIQTIGNMPNDQVQQFIQARKDDWQNAKSPAETDAAQGAYDMAVKVAKQRDDEFFKSPATYMLNHNDTVGRLYANYQQQPTPQNFQIYAAFSAGQQEKLYPGVSPNILTDDMKQDIGIRMASVTQDPQGALAAGQILSDTQKLTGQFWNEAAHELYKDHIVSPAQFASAQLLGSPKSWSLAQEGFRAASIPDNVLTTTSGISKEAADKVAADALRPLLATFADTADGHELVASYVDFASNVMRARGKVDPTTAAALAQTAVLDRFTIKNNLRIPNELDANDVADGGDNILAHIDQHKLVSPPSFSGAGEAVQGASYADDIKNFGHWSTNAKGDGMILYDQYGAPVYENVKGSKVPVQVEIPFATAAKLGSQIRSPLNTAERIITNPRSVPGLVKTIKEDQALYAEERAANPDGR